MPVKLLLALTKLDEIGGNLENTAPLPLFFCQPLNAERPILLCYSFSRGIFLEINNYLYINTITYNHHHSIFKSEIFLSNLLFIFLCFRSSTINNMRPRKQKFKLVYMKKDLTHNPQNYPPCAGTLQLITSQKICLSIINNEPRS